MLLSELIIGKKIISIIGLAKNTGKTVVLNCLINEMKERDKSIGLTSIGHDGEMYDSILSNFKKPRIFVNTGNLIATTDKLLEQSEIETEYLNKTNIQTALGEVIICKVIQSGYVELAGPCTLNKMKHISNLMIEYGVETVFVDGSINRKCIASPDFCDGFILATGAVIDRNLDNVISYTHNKIELMSLPKLKRLDIKKIIQSYDNTMIIDSDLKPFCIEQAIDISNYKQILTYLDSESEYVYFHKSLIENVVRNILKTCKEKLPILIINDSTKHFIGIRMLKDLKKRGSDLLVTNSSNLIAVTINPIAPNAHMYDSGKFLEKMRKVLPNIQVFDVLNDSYNKTSDK